MKNNRDYRTSKPNANNITESITYSITNDFEEVKPQYTNESLPDGSLRARVVGMHTIKCIQEETYALNIGFVFEIQSQNQIIKKVQPVFHPGEEAVNFAYIEEERLSQLNFLLYDLCHHPEKRLGSEGDVIIKTEEVNGEVIQYIEKFIPDVDFDDLVIETEHNQE